MPAYSPEDLAAIQAMLADAGQAGIHLDTIAAWLNARPSQRDTAFTDWTVPDTGRRVVRRNFTTWLLRISEADYYRQVAMDPAALADAVAAAQQQLLDGQRPGPTGGIRINPDRCTAAAAVLASRSRGGLDPRVLNAAFWNNPQLYVDAVVHDWDGTPHGRTVDVCDRLYQAVTGLLLGLDESSHDDCVRDNPGVFHVAVLAAQDRWLADNNSQAEAEWTKFRTLEGA